MTATVELEAARAAEQAKYAALAAKGGSYGSTNHGKNAANMVASLCVSIIRTGMMPTVADFGCGRNNFCRSLMPWAVDARGIDFAFPEADIRRPMHDTGLPTGWADVVVSFDALEHCLPAEVDEVIAEMRRVAKGPFVMSIGTRPSIARGVNGEDLHPTLRPLAWWLERLGGGAAVVQGYVVGDWSKKQ